MLEITINNMVFRLLNVHTPNTEPTTFFGECNTLIQEGAHDYKLICGDLNLTLNTDTDSCNYKHINKPQLWRVILDTMNTSDLIHHNPLEPSIIIIIMYLYSAQYLHILQDSKRYLTHPTVQVQPQLTSNSHSPNWKTEAQG